MTEPDFPIKYFTLATAGHVDHGKTSLLKALTGIDPDRLKEEKERGMTTDLGFAHLRLPDNLVIGFIDVPGHGKFLKNMLAGVGGIEIALLVVAADEGPMPQTLEHVRILGLLGIKAALVAITKVDLVDPELVGVVEQEVRDLLAGEGIDVMDSIPVSSVKGTGVDTLKTVLVERLKQLPEQRRQGAAFLPVDRVFSKSGFGTVITGTLVRGQLSVGDQVSIEPGGASGRVRRLETFGRSLERACAGQRLACNLVLKDDAALTRGHVVLGEHLSPTNQLLVHLVRLPEITSEGALADLAGQPIRLYHGTAECHGRIRWLEPIDQGEETGRRGGREAIVAFALSDPVVAEAQDRFVIRLSDDSIYGGTIMMRDQPRWLTRSKMKSVAEQLLKSDFRGAAVSYVLACPQRMVQHGHLDRLLPTAIKDIAIASLIDGGSLSKLGDYLLTRAYREELAQKVVSDVTAFVKARQEGMESPQIPLEQLRTQVMPVSDRAAFQALIQEICDQGSLLRQGDKLSLPGMDVSATSPQQEALSGEIEKILAAHLCLELAEITKLTGRSLKEVKAALEHLTRSNRAAVVDYEYAASAATLGKAHKVLARLWDEKKQITPSEFKEAMGTTRKYAMALLAYFDDRKVTRRVAEGRALLLYPKA